MLFMNNYQIMKRIINVRFAGTLISLGILCLAGNVVARENVSNTQHKASPKTTAAAGCQPALGQIDMDINNVRAHLMTGGDMWWNIGLQVAAYEIPIGSGKSSQFAASCWIGGFDKQGQLKVAGQTYRQSGNDFWPGALDGNAQITSGNCNLWDYQWKVAHSTINDFIAAYKAGGNLKASEFQTINQWPGAGSMQAASANGSLLLGQAPYLGRTYAAFKDLYGTGVY